MVYLPYLVYNEQTTAFERVRGRVGGLYATHWLERRGRICAELQPAGSEVCRGLMSLL